MGAVRWMHFVLIYRTKRTNEYNEENYTFLEKKKYQINQHLFSFTAREDAIRLDAIENRGGKRECSDAGSDRSL